MNREPIISQCRINLEAVSLNDLSWSFNGYKNVNIVLKLLNYEYKNCDYDVDISEKYKVVVKYTLYLAPIKLRY